MGRVGVLLSLDPTRPPTVPRDAASVILLQPARDGGPGAEVLCVVRHARSGFLGGAVVFPGGKVDPADAEAVWSELSTEPHPRGAELIGPGGAPSARTLAVAACRETLEEACVLPLAQGDAELVEPLRRAAPSEGLAAALAAKGLRVALDRLVPWARWVTPEAESRRFDARFYLLPMPPAQVARHDERETTHSFWARPEEVLAKSERAEIFLAPPTIRTLELLTGCDVEGAIALASRQSLLPVCPTFVPDADGGFLALPGDPEHAVGERRVEGPTRFVLREGRFVSTNAPA